MTKYTIEEIEKMNRRAWLSIAARTGRAPKLAELVEELRAPKPKFAEGQVAMAAEGCPVIVGRLVSDSYTTNTGLYRLATLRHLTQTEVGPDWVKREAAMRLRDAVARLIEHGEDLLPSTSRFQSPIKIALNTFDAEANSDD